MNRTDIYNKITDKLMSKISAGKIPWRQSWSVGVPRNVVSKRAYNGINFLSLITEDFPSPNYLTYLQCKQLNGTINRGATGQLIVFGRY